MCEYPQTGQSAGNEASSTYEGRYLTILESELTHPSHTDGFVDGGDPVLHGENIVGVAMSSAAAATDVISIDTEGIWYLTVYGTDQSGNIAVAAGDEVFINKTTCLLSKNSDKAATQRFGYALDAVVSGTSEVIAVKVHWNPDDAYEQVGVSAAFKSMGAYPLHAREYRYRATGTSGIQRGEYIAFAMNGAGLSGEAHRARTIVEAVGVATAMGASSGLEFDTDGTLTGLGVGHRATVMAPDRATFGTLAGGMSELWAEGDATDFGTSMHSIHRFVMDGDTTGYATADNVFEFVNLSAVQYAGNTDTPDHALRVIINGNVRYIMVSEATS